MDLQEAVNSFTNQAETKKFFEKLHLAKLEGEIENLEDVVAAQSRLIDNVLTRLVVLDKDFDPTIRGNWELIEEGQAITRRLDKERPDAGRVVQENCGAVGDGCIGDPD